MARKWSPQKYGGSIKGENSGERALFVRFVTVSDVVGGAVETRLERGLEIDAILTLE